ncbi:lipopolysaccharide export system protein LptA [Silvibacterium bohemicum]|uniref:Lipopolysaccharide export system protein LptA n=1 Tax=Silvibacterium bohemicum TaxID=1577686 RepID=A0A841K451_9BACT|nr:LptA/OstA family protein [Silvibacterium bohemicum]MBB6145408.1 lipopolysaccharide export system protein LptA [Silvibacterium bohemicum]
MRLTVARLRQSIVLLACLLFVVLAAFFLYARYRFRHFEKDLPARLGIDIQQTADGFTFSHSAQGHTLYTIHASKLFQYKQGGHATLHDVQITLYGAPGSNRADKIYGSEFDYDKSSGIVSAKGNVQIDLSGLGDDSSAGKAAPAKTGQANQTNQPNQANQPGQTGQDDAKAQQQIIHIKTSGLVFNEKTGDAVTSEHTEFSLPKAAGSSTGASYNSKTGLLVLDQEVVLTTSNNGNLAIVHATHATLLRDSRQAFLLHPSTDYQTEKSSSDQAIIYFRKDGSASSVDSQGHVRMLTDSGAVLTAENSHTQLDAKSQPVQIDVAGGVNFVSNGDNSSMHGTAVSCTLTLGANSTLKHGRCRDAVSFVEQIFKLANDPRGTASRQVQSSMLDVDFVPGPDGKKSIAQKALATGNAQVNLHTIPSKGGQELTNISGDQLLATLDPTGTAIKQLDGSGSTKIVDLAQDGSTNTSSGDRLHMTFTQQPKAAKETDAKAGAAKANVVKTVEKAAAGSDKKSASDAETSQIDTAIQDGHVVMTQTPVKKEGAKSDPTTLTSWANHAEYHSSDQILHLTGSPRLKDGDALQMSAQFIDYHRDSGDATAQGTLKATYRQQNASGAQQPIAGAGVPDLGGSGPVYITADRGDLRHATNVSLFYGSATTPARMWQSDHSIAAPVLEVSQNPQALKAYGPEGSTAAVVSANLTSNLGAKHQPSVVRIHSRTLEYSDAERRADFHGSVVAEEPDGVIHSDAAQVFLSPKPAGNQQTGNSSAAKTPASGAQPQDVSQIDHMVATGNVVMTQPGRKATGEKLVYTSDDGKYVLTGAPGNLPHVFDKVKGTTTGARLIFNSQDDSVVVSGGQSSAVTETRTPK